MQAPSFLMHSVEGVTRSRDQSSKGMATTESTPRVNSSSSDCDIEIVYSKINEIRNIGKRVKGFIYIVNLKITYYKMSQEDLDKLTLRTMSAEFPLKSK
jgi:hypothetical protein